MVDDRRRLPGSVGVLWCRRCQRKFMVAGRRITAGEGPLIEPVVCPHCRDLRRMVLPPMVGTPFRVMAPGEPMRDD